MKTFFLPGGDSRQQYLGAMLAGKGYKVIRFLNGGYRYMTKQGEGADDSLPLPEAMAASHCILGPVPFTRDGRLLFSAVPEEQLETEALLGYLTERHIFFGGNLPPQARDRCIRLGIPCYDFMKMEEVALKNTIATAEGALAEAIRLSPINLHGSRCLVLGYGRCGQTLSDKLKALDASVTTADHKKEQLALASSRGIEPLLFQAGISVALPESGPAFGSGIPHWELYDCIFNTIPAPALDRTAVFRMKKDAVIIDLASAPGGTDFDACRAAGIRAQLCTGLPGLFSPKTSAEILCQAVLSRTE
ncbi:MAG: dipicolinate synthase subunit DpsA [Enterocloster sp.]